MRIWIYRGMMLFLMLGWMLVIFRFSAQPAQASTEASGSVVYRLIDMSEQMFRIELSEDERLWYAEMLEYPVRKIAHMAEYAILNLFCFGFYRSLNIKGYRCYLIAFVTAVGYAATDEIHQLFVPGRSGQLSDVCIDTVGVLLMLLALSVTGKIYRKHCEKKKLPLK